MAALLVRPYRMLDQRGVDSFYALLSTYPIWIGLPLTWKSQALRRASELPTNPRLQTPCRQQRPFTKEQPP
jgi:hypothetical protein